MSNTRVCRISGLTSSKGQRFNGSAALVSLDGSQDAGGADRLPVYIDGEPTGPVSLKRSNVEILPYTAIEYEVGVGRGSLRDSMFNAIVSDTRSPGSVLTGLKVSGGAPRSRGNLMAIEECLKIRKKKGLKGSFSVKTTDLNIARAVNRIASGEENVSLHGTHNQKLQSVAKLLRRENKGGSLVVVKFDSHRISPDGLEGRQGVARVGAAKRGDFKVYPCPYEKYLDAMEVRFVDTTSTEKIVIKQETYLDYGVEETEFYVRHAVALGETSRLLPSVLAQVDPQAFWAALLHVEAFVNELKRLEESDLVTEWKDLVAGVEISRQRWSREVRFCNMTLPPAAAAGIGDNWGIQTEKNHKKVSDECAIAALLMMMHCANEHAVDGSEGTMPTSERNLLPVVVESFDYYKGGELDRLVAARTRAGELERAHVARGKKLKEKHRDRYLNQALEECGFGSDALDLNSDPLRHCGHCGSVDKKLKFCSRCNGAAYCSPSCQSAEWNSHRKECCPVLSQGRRLMRDCHRRSGCFIESFEVYKPRSTLPTTNCVMTETSGIGSVGIVWCPGVTCHLNFTDFSNGVPLLHTPLHNPGEHVVTFKDLSELPSPLRFLLTCGPLPDIAIAQRSLDETVRTHQGNISKLRVNVVGFSALEWAAKKGNKETVEWLCTDDRTKALLSEGCPVGWACYTGQVEIARYLVELGADPGATDAVLWNGTPPLLVAAQNGQFEVMKYLVDELGQDIHMRDPVGRDVIASIKTAKNYRDLEGHYSAYKWAKKKMK